MRLKSIGQRLISCEQVRREMIPYKDLLAYDINRNEQANKTLARVCLYTAVTAIQHAADKQYKEAA